MNSKLSLNNNQSSDTDSTDFDLSTETTALMDAHVGESHVRPSALERNDLPTDKSSRKKRPKNAASDYGVNITI